MSVILKGLCFLIQKATLFLVLAIVRGYRFFISPLFPPCCRFQPSCSTYAIQALQTHGILYGSFLTLRRLLRCHPWSKHQHHDPVPKRELN